MDNLNPNKKLSPLPQPLNYFTVNDILAEEHPNLSGYWTTMDFNNDNTEAYITYMMEDARNITSCTHLLFVAKNIERSGDHATNIAEHVQFLVSGEVLMDYRPNVDESSEVVVAPHELNNKSNNETSNTHS